MNKFKGHEKCLFFILSKSMHTLFIGGSMKKLKIIVYAICKNESQFVDRWVDSMQEADAIYVLDTGSTDDTVEKLKKRNVNVFESVISPWRFDVARNESLKHVPEDVDVCVCTDLDEFFDKNWRLTLEKDWVLHQPTRAHYNYNWKIDEDGHPRVSFWSDKIHARKDYSWKNPVHEILFTSNSEKIMETSIVLNHYPDPQKSRSSYLPLLEMSVEEDPLNDRNLHYLGREYMFYQKWDECISTLHKHLHCKNALWKDERCASMRFMGRAYQAKEYLEEAEFWFLNAIAEAPHLREGYIELATLYIQNEKYEKAYSYLKQAEMIKEKSKSYINEEFAWNDSFYDLLSLASFYTGKYQEAVENLKQAILLNPHEPRYQQNLKMMTPYSL